jgi:hypothetical protein
MATILDLAEHADLPAETVLRVLLREPVNEAAEKRVAEAVEALGLPDYPRPDGHVEVLPAVEEQPPPPAALPARTAPPAVTDEHTLVELFQVLLDRLDRNRRERIDDLALTVDLTTEGWRMVDRRLGRLEKIIDRLSREDYFERRGQPGRAEIRHLDDIRRKAPDANG